jgi:ATP synthase F1 gamma subunit
VSQSAVIKVKKELRTTTDLMDLVDVLKRVAAAQFQMLEDKRKQSGWTGVEVSSEGEKPVSQQALQEWEWAKAMAGAKIKGPQVSLTAVLEDFLSLIPSQQCRHPFMLEASPPLGIVIMATDEGFLGGLNATVIQKALAARGDQQAELMVLGERGGMVLRDYDEPFTSFPGVGENINSRDVEKLRDYIVEQYLLRKFSTVLVFYPRCISFTRQEIESLQLLPCKRPSPGIASLNPTEVILEPSAYSIIDYLIRLWLGRKLHEVFWQSRLSELAARSTHLEASLQGLKDQKKKLTLQYFRSKHEVTDTGIRESFAGMIGKKNRG